MFWINNIFGLDRHIACPAEHGKDECMSDCKNCNLMKEKDEYITDIEEECENLQEQNRTEY